MHLSDKVKALLPGWHRACPVEGSADEPWLCAHSHLGRTAAAQGPELSPAQWQGVIPRQVLARLVGLPVAMGCEEGSWAPKGAGAECFKCFTITPV